MRNNGDDAVGCGTTSATLPGRSPSPQTDDADARLTADPAMIVPGIDATKATAAAEARASLEVVGAAHRKRQRAGAVAAIALLVVVAAGVSIAVVFSSRGSHGVDVPEKFSGTFTSQDSVLAQLKYTGRLHKSTDDAGRAVLEAEITHVDPWTQQRNVVTLLNRRAYWRVYNDSISTTEPIATKCYPKERIPPVGDLDALFRQASATPQGAVDPNHPGMTPCVAAGNRWIVQWGLQSFVYCQPQSDTHVVVGPTHSVSFVADAAVTRVGVSIPVDPATGQPLDCPIIEEISTLGGNLQGHKEPSEVAAARRLASRRSLASYSQSWWSSSSSSSYSYSYSYSSSGGSSSSTTTTTSSSSATFTETTTSPAPPPRVCVFVGGLGLQAGSSPYVTSSGEDNYWGGYITVFLGSLCSEFRYVAFDSKRGWDSTQLSDTFCEAAAGGTGQEANDILVFSHASGGLVVANALASNRCSFASNVQWYTAATPFHGAKGADRALADVCPSYSAVREFLDSMFYCKGRDHDQLHAGMATLQTAYVTGNDVSYVADSYLSGALCGHSAEGLNEGLAQALPDVAATMAWGGHENDGIIDVEVCKLIHSGFVKYDLSAQWADMHINHVDTSCRYGDANYDPYFDHSPCTWMQAMAARM